MLVPGLYRTGPDQLLMLGKKITKILISSSVQSGRPRDWGDKQGSWIGGTVTVL